MAADLHIHVLEGIDEETLAKFFSNTLGSKYFNPTTVGQFDIEPHSLVSNTPNIWIGEVSWLKAGLMESPETFIPPTVAEIQSLIGESLPVLDDELEEALLKAMSHENPTGYRLAKLEDVKLFLGGHKGRKLFTVSW